LRLCHVCGQPVPRFRDAHPKCLQTAARAKIQDHWDEVRDAKASGALATIGATIFVFDAVRPLQPTYGERIDLATLCWAYRRRVIHWSMPGLLSIIPVPYRHTHELVMCVHNGAGLTTWKQVVFPGTKLQVHQSIAELMRRAPWALYGFAIDTRLAMSVGRCVETTRAIESRRLSMIADEARVAAPVHEAAAAALEAERVQRIAGFLRD
jgi:hypothetical protein